MAQICINHHVQELCDLMELERPRYPGPGAEAKGIHGFNP